MSKTLLKITMPSAPSVSIAPFDAQTIGLTDWDNDITVGGLTYRATSFALGDATSSQDFSQGKGGFALGNQIDHIALENGLDGGGLLSSYVDSGAIPLNGATAQLLDETGAITVQTWVFCEKAVDGATLSFSLRTPGYMSTKLVRFPASRYDGAVDVGLAVGDDAVQGITSAGRYKGVSVPTKAFATWEPLQYPGISVSGKRGNPSSWGAMEYGSTTHPYDYVGTAPSGSFCFVFPSKILRDEFYLQYNGDATSLTGAYIAPNSCVLVSDGSNSEIIAQSDSNGLVTYPDSTGTYFTKDVRTINAIVYYVLYLFVKSDGMLASSQASSIQLFFLQQDNPICAGASSAVGFQSKSSSASEYGITSPASIVAIKNNILYLLPTQQSTDGFLSWTELDNPRGFAIDASAYKDGVTSSSGDPDDTSSFSFYNSLIESISSKPGIIPFPFIVYIHTHHTLVLGTKYLEIHIVHFLNDADFNFEISKVFVDSNFFVTSTKHESEGTRGWIDPFSSSQQSETDNNIEFSLSKQLSGPGYLNPKYTFDSIASVNSSNSNRVSLYSAYEDNEAEITEKIYQIVLYAITKLAFGSNPAVVVPGNFPGTSNPTTTPILAATQLAAWLGLAPKLTGGITPSSGTWGEYIGASPDEDDTTYGKQRLGDLLEEAWIYGQEANSTAKAPDLEVPEYPVLPPASVDDLVTEPSWDYDYAGTSKQFTAAIKNVGESFDISKGDGYFWGGWQEKDACHFSASPGSSVLAMCQMEDCLAVVGADGYLRCSYDGGVTWPFSLNLGDTSDGMIMAGNGIMLAFAYASGNVVVARSIDAGRTWSTSSPAALAGATIPGSWYDADSQRFWLCGSLSGGGASLWYSSDGITWTHISAELSIGSRANRIAASGNLLVVSAAPDTWGIWVSTNLGATWTRTPALPQTGIAEPFLGRWNGAFRVAVGTTLYSSPDLSAWTSISAPAALQAFATDGAVVSALAVESSGGNHVYYSRDQGATWRAVQISPEGATWASTGALAAIWDDNEKCFHFSDWGPKRIVALGDPSVLDIWHRCRASCLANSNAIATATYKTPGLYDSSELLRWLLDCKDGTDSEYQQARIDWITKGARFVTLRGRYSSIVDQLSVAAGLPITIPRKILTYSGNAANIPTTGIVSKATHHLSGDDKGLSEIEIIMPPL